MTDMTAAYAARAAEYADALGSMTAVHPSDRQLVESWAASVNGRVLDAGCGPGHWTSHLAGLGIDVRGIDLVPTFVEHARTAYPGIRFDVESMDRLNEPDAALGGILSWFSTIHHEPSAISLPIGEFARALRPGGRLLLGYFEGSPIEAFDHAVLRAYRWPAEELRLHLEAAGFGVLEMHRRATRGQRPVGAIVCERIGSLSTPADAARGWGNVLPR